MPGPEGVNPERHNQEQGRAAARERQLRGGDSSNLPAEIHEKVVDAPRNSRTLVDRRIATTLDQMGGHHQLLGGTEQTQKEELSLHIIAEEDIPEGYFANQQRIAREQGHGDIPITAEVRAEAARVIRTDQQGSLEMWVNYLNDPDTHYPENFKYFVLRNVLQMGVYDKKQGRYGKRSRGTTAPYPELNREALALVYDQYTTGKSIPERKEEEEALEETQEILTPDERFLRVLKPADFGKDYSKALELTRPKDQDLSNIDGQWLTFPQTEDPEKVYELATFLQGKGTEWCTAGVETAKSQLQAGDFHVFASYDAEGNPTSPRIAIRMEEGEVVEVRGIQPEQALEPQLLETAEAQLQTLPGGEAYQQKVADMKMMTKLEKKQKEGETLTIEELRFLYELDRKIQGFGYEADPRIKDLLGQREKRADGCAIFDCDPDQIALTVTELTSESTVLFGSLNGRKISEIPENLTQVSGNADFKNSDIHHLGSLETIGGNAYFVNSQVQDLGRLTTIGGDALFKHSQIKSLGNLTIIGGLAAFSESEVRDLGSLTTIGGSAYFEDSQIRALGNLTTIGGNADFWNSQVESLGNLTTVGGDVNFRSSHVQNLGNLTTIGGDANLRDSRVQNLGNLTTIGGVVNFARCQVESLGNLTSIGMDVSFGDSQVEDLGNLTTIGGNAFFNHSPRIKDLGNLTHIGGDARFEESHVQDLGKLTTIGRDASFQRSQIPDLGKLTTIGRNADFQDSRLRTLGALSSVGGNALFGGSQVQRLDGLTFIGGSAFFIASPVSELGALARIEGKAFTNNFIDTEQLALVTQGEIISER